jgi:hypothetical protein
MKADAPSLPGWRWAALLGFALIGPVSLPVGGGERRQPEVRRRSNGEPLLAQACSTLKAAPSCQAPDLARLAIDQPLRVMRQWRGGRGERWLMVEAQASAGSGSGPGTGRRGWLLLESRA